MFKSQVYCFLRHGVVYVSSKLQATVWSAAPTSGSGGGELCLTTGGLEFTLPGEKLTDGIG